MKFVSYIASIILWLSVPQMVSAQWTDWAWKKIALPAQFSDGYFLGIYFLPDKPNFGWVCGFKGYTMRTTDGGNTWSGTVISNAPQLESIKFLNENVGYCSGTNDYNPGQGGVYKSTDGGRSWQEITPVVLTNQGYVRASVWGNDFIDENTGIVVGGGCGGERQSFYRTTDGGNQWKVFRADFGETGMSHVKMMSAAGLCYASSSGYVWRSTDGGLTWNPFSKTGSPSWQESLKIYNNSICVATDGQTCTGQDTTTGTVRFSPDLGQTWREFNTHTAMFGTWLINDSVAWASGHDRSMYRTSNKGQTWVPYQCGFDADVNLDDLLFINDTLGFGVGSYGGIYRTYQPPAGPKIQIQGDTILCAGDSLALSVLFDGRKFKFKWSSGDTTDKIVVKKSGVYSVRAYYGTDCYYQLPEVSVLVNPPPHPSVKSSDNNNHLCLDEQVALWIDGLYKSVLWSTGETSQSIQINKPGTYYVSVVSDRGCPGISDSIVVIGGVPVTPQILSTHNRFCEGDSVLLTGQAGFASYRWSTGDTLRSVYIKQTGSYDLTVVDKYGCVWKSNPLSISVDANPIFIVTTGKSAIDLAPTPAGEMRCEDVTIKNLLDSTISIEAARFARNVEFSVPQSQLSFSIAALSEQSLTLCYRPSALGEQTDTLVVGDYCKRIAVVRSEGDTNHFNSPTRCNLPFVAATVNIETPGLFIHSIYPNPADGVVAVVAVMRNSEPVQRASLFDIYGHELRISEAHTAVRQPAKGLTVLAFSFDVESLPAGRYVLQVRSSTEFRSASVQVVH